MPVPPTFHINVSERAARVLVQSTTFRVLGCTCSRAELEETLHARDLPSFEAVLAVEETLGGIRSGLFTFGTCLLLRGLGEGHMRSTTPSGEPLVLIGLDSSNLYYVAPTGDIWARPPGARGSLRMRAVSAIKLLEKLVMESEVSATAALQIRLTGRIGEALAAELGTPLDRDASDEVQPWWQFGDVTLTRGKVWDWSDEPDADETTAWARSVRAAGDLLRAAARLGARAQMWPAISRLGRGSGPSPSLPVRREEVLGRAAAPASTRPPELTEDTSAASLGYIPRRPRETGTVWITGTGDDTALHQIKACGDRVVEWERLLAAGIERTHFTSATEALAGVLSESALRGIAAGGGRLDPRRTCSRRELADLLAANKMPVHESVLAFEERFGGLSFTAYREYFFGASPILLSPSTFQRLSIDGETVVLIGSSDDVGYFMDAAGAVHENWDMSDETQRVANSAQELIEELAVAEVEG